MNCRECSSLLETKHRFCHACGAKVPQACHHAKPHDSLLKAIDGLLYAVADLRTTGEISETDYDELQIFGAFLINAGLSTPKPNHILNTFLQIQIDRLYQTQPIELEGE